MAHDVPSTTPWISTVAMHKEGSNYDISGQELQEHLQDLQEHLQDLQEHLQDHFYYFRIVWEGFTRLNLAHPPSKKIVNE